MDDGLDFYVYLAASDDVRGSQSIADEEFITVDVDVELYAEIDGVSDRDCVAVGI